MRLLFDTNVIIPGEPAVSDGIRAEATRVVELVRIVNEGGHLILVHPVVHFDIDRDHDESRRDLRRLLVGKYARLEAPPPVPPEWATHVGSPPPHSNDWVDNHLLATLSRNAVHLLVTEDRQIHRKARRLGLDHRVVTVADAAAMLRALQRPVIAAPPDLADTVCHAFDAKAPFFDSLRADYGPSFDEWLLKCQEKQRRCWLVRGERQSLAAIAIYKDEEKAFGVEGKILKLCTFKVDDAHRGKRLGELLLKAAFQYAARGRYDAMYVTVFPKHGQLVDLFTDFGFELRTSMPNGEAVYFKELRPHVREGDTPLAMHVRHGPPFLRVDDVPAFFVPIEPRYHQLLFPDAEAQRNLIAATHPFANGLRKAYLSRANRRELPLGAPLLFYRSEAGRHVRVLGVVEGTLRSADAEEIAAFVGKRTVYPFDQIAQRCQEGPVLAILFRQAVVLDTPMSYESCLASGALAGPPQSITELKQKAHPWFRQQLAQSYSFPFGLSTQSRS